MNDKIKVVIKLRPLIEKEKDSNFFHWGVKGSTIFQIDPATRKLKNDSYTFDHIFDQSSTNQEIFSTVVKPIVDAAIQGFNGTIFAYGQTSSGKTHTMTGTLMQPGIIPTAIKYMFSSLEMDKKREFLLRVSYLEIYNEKVNDLLGNAQNILLREDSNGQITVGAEERVCNCVDKVLENMAEGEKIRRIGETNMNERSSRSHTIFRVILESSIKRTTSTSEEENEDEGFVKISQLNLVDLAGSERAGQSGTTGDRFKEGCHINSSLTTLGLVIKQLGDGNEGQHISFRDSKLTRLLKPSLGGNALTVIICTVTPTVIDQTLNTLNFALRAKKVKNKPELNEASDDAALLKRYRKKIAILSQELENTKKRNSSTEELETKIQDLQKQERRIAKMKEDLINSGVSDIRKNNQALGRSKRRRTWGGQLESSLLLPMRVQLSTIKEDSMASSRQCKSIGADNISETEVKKSQRTPISAQDIGKENGDVGLFKHPGLCGVIKPITPETPPRVLRERIRSEADHAKSLETEYIQLKEFTTLEKQIYHADGRKFEEDNEALNEKLSNALSSITELTGDKAQLENQLKEQISTVQKLKSKLIDIAVIKENTEKKFAERENELRKSLEEAWENLRQKDATINLLKGNIDQLQSNLRVCVDNSGASSLMEQNIILQQKLNHFMKIDQQKSNLEFQVSLLTPLAEQIALKETEIQNQNFLLAQRAKIHEEENQHMMSQVEIFKTKLTELNWTSESENKYQQQNLLLTKEIEIKDKEIKTLLSTNESLLTNLKELEIITKCKSTNKNLLAEEVENKDEKMNLLICSNEILERKKFDYISGNENEVRQLIKLIEYKDQEVSNLKTHNLRLQNDLKRLQFISEHENKLQERILELTDELESKHKVTLNLNNHSENLGISSGNSLDNQEQIVSVIDKNQLDKANCTQISQYNISEKYDISVMQDNIEFIPCDESLLFKDPLSRTINYDPLQSFSLELDSNFENRTAIQGENFLLIEPNIQLENKLGYTSPLQQENIELLNKMYELESILENSTLIQDKNLALARKLTLLKSKAENVSTIQQVNIKLSNKAKELELILENSNTIEKENLALSENIKILESKLEHIFSLQENNNYLIHKKRNLEQQLEMSKVIDEENLMLLEKIKLIDGNLKDMFTLQEKNQELSNQIEHLERNLENNIGIQNKNIELEDKLKLLGSNVDQVSALQQENKELSDQIENMERNFKNNNEVKNKNIELKEKIKLLDYDIDHASKQQQENNDLLKKIEELERNSENITVIQNENMKLKERLILLHSNMDYASTLQQVNKELSNEIDELEKNSDNIITIQKENVILKERLALLHSTLSHTSALQQENRELSNKIEEIETNLETISEIHKKNIELKEKLNSNEDHVSALQQENDELTNKLEELERNSENITTIQNENFKLKERLKLMVSNLSDISTLKQENKELTNQIDELEINSENITVIQNENMKLKERLILLHSNKDNASTLQEVNEELSNEIDELEKNSDNVITIQKENVKLKERLTLLHNNLSHTSAIQQENRELSNKIEEMETNLETISEIHKKNIELKEKLNSNEDHVSALQQENDELTNKSEELERNSENITTIQNENFKLKERLRLMVSNLSNISTLKQENKELTNQIDELEINSENITVIQNENMKLKERLILLHSNMDNASTLQQVNKELSNEIDELEKNSDNVITIQKENVKLKERLTLLHNNLSHTSAIQQENRELSNKIEEMETSLETISEIHKKNIELKEKLNSNEDHVSALQQENDELTNKLEELERNSENITTIQNENFKLKERLRLMVSNLSNISTLKQENKELTNQIDELEINSENITVIQNENMKLKERLILLHSNKDYASTLQQVNKELLNEIDEHEQNLESNSEKQKKNFEFKEKFKILVNSMDHVSALQEENYERSNKIEELECISENITTSQNKNIKLKEPPIFSENTVENISTLPQNNTELSNKSQKLNITLDRIHPVKEENLEIFESTTEYASMLQVLSTVEEQPKYSEKNDQKSLSRIKDLEKTISQLNKRNITLFESVQNNDLLKDKIIKEILSLDPNTTEKLHKFKNTELFDKLIYVLLRKEEEMLSKFQDSCEAKVTDAQEKNKQLEVQTDRLRKWITEIENENERLSKELATILSDHEHIKSQLKIKNNEIKEKDDKLSLIENKILLLQEESLNCYTELNAIQKEHKLCKIPEHFNEKLKELQDALKTKDILVKIQAEKVNSLTMTEVQLLRSLETEKMKNKELSDSITDQSKELKVLELSCKRSKDELNAKNDEYNCLISEIRLKEDKWKFCVCQQKENLTKSQCQSVIDEYKELLFHLKDHPHGIIKKLNSIADNFNLLKSVIELFKEKIEQEELVSMKQIKDLETKLAEKDKICQELASNINNLTKMSTNNNKLVEDLRIKDDNLKTVIKNLEEKTKECSVVLLKLEEVENTLDAKNVENNKNREIYLKTCKELENLKTTYIKEKEQNNNLTEKIESLLLQVNELSNKNAIVEEQLDMFKCKLSKKEDFFQKVGEVLQKSPSSLSEVLFTITEKMSYINELQEKLEVIQNVNNKLNTDYVSLKTEIIQRDEELSVVLQREQTLKEQYQILKMQIHPQINSDLHSNGKSLNEFESHLFDIIPGNPTNLSEAFFIISNVFKEVEHLKSNIELMQEEKDNLDKECDFMNDILKGTEQDLLNTQLQCSEYASNVTALKAQILETKQTLQEKVKHSETLLKDNDELKREVSRYADIIHNTNKKVNTECDFACTEKRDEEFTVVLQREQSLKKQDPKLKTQINTNIHPNGGVLNFESQLFDIIPGKPTSLSEAFGLISNVFKEVEHLKDNIKLIQEEKDTLDKECDMMNGLIKDTEKDLFSALRKCSDYVSDVTDLKNQITETKQSLQEKAKLSETLFKDNDALKLEVSVYENVIREHRKEKGKMMLQISEYKNKIKTCDIELQQLKLQEKHLNGQINNMTELYNNAIRSLSSVECHCEEFKDKVTELTINVADRNAKITALELQIQSDNVPLKKHVTDLENSLEQAKEKIKELKSDTLHYQMLSQGNSLRGCEICRRRIERQVHTSVQTTYETSVPSTSSSSFEVQGSIEDKYLKCKREIDILKRICRYRNKKIEKLEKELNNGNVVE